MSSGNRKSVQVDFGAEKTVGRVELYMFNDGRGVRSPLGCSLIYWHGPEGKPMEVVLAMPQKPTQGKVNTIHVKPVRAGKIGVFSDIIYLIAAAWLNLWS